MGNFVFPSELIPFVEEMLLDFAQEFHEVCLVPGNDDNKTTEGRMIRVASNRNPKWYRDMCAAYPKGRPRKKPQTSVEKGEVLASLRRVVERGYTRSKYAGFFLGEAKRRYELEGFKLFDDQF